MPDGLFDSVTPFLAGLGQHGILGRIGGGLQNAQNANTIDQVLGPGMGQLMLSNPGAAQQLYGRQIMQQTYSDLLRGGMDPQRAGIMAMHPEALSEQGKPINVPPGGSVVTPLFGMMGGGAAPNSSQQQPPSSQPGPSNASIGGPPSGSQFSNQNGLMNPRALMNLVEMRLKGKDINPQLGGGLSGMGAINRSNFQDLLAQTMQQRGVTPSDLASRDAKYPAYEKATDTNAQTASRMQLAQSEALGMLPLLKQAAAATNPTNFPIFNRAKLEVLAQTGDPRSAALASYANALINTYARGISTRPQGATDSDKQHLREVVDPYWSKGQWEAGARAIANELGVAHASIAKNQNRIDVQFGFGKDADPNDVASAKAAIARGADKEDVTRRFEEGGFNAPKF